MDSINHVLSKIRETKINSLPFPHLIIDNFLPEDLYNKIIEKIHNNDPFNNLPNDHNRVTKTIYNFDKFGDELKDANEDITLEKEFASIITNKSIISILQKKFTEKRIIPDNIKFNHKGTLIQLDCFRGNYNYKIHTDSLIKYITIVFYLPKDDNNMELGTNLYSNDVKSVKNAGYKRNRCIIFHPENIYDPENRRFPSYHNMQGNTPENFRRFSFQCWYVYEKCGYSSFIRSGNNTN